MSAICLAQGDSVCLLCVATLLTSHFLGKTSARATSLLLRVLQAPAGDTWSPLNSVQNLSDPPRSFTIGAPKRPTAIARTHNSAPKTHDRGLIKRAEDYQPPCFRPTSPSLALQLETQCAHA